MYYQARSFLGSWEAVCTIFFREAVWNIVLGGYLHFYQQHRIAFFFSVAFRIKSDTDRLSLLSYLGFGSAWHDCLGLREVFE